MMPSKGSDNRSELDRLNDFLERFTVQKGYHKETQIGDAWNVRYIRINDSRDRNAGFDQLTVTFTVSAPGFLTGKLVLVYRDNGEGLLGSEVLTSERNPTVYWAVIHELPKKQGFRLAVIEPAHGS